MKRWRLDAAAVLAFLLIAAPGWWLWSGEGPAVWLSDIALMCGFG
ncbi:hypothetical protein [Sphingopyxis sp. MWB1]|nr:hypothetical protein [Sphingopyxis sp. MWB1]